MDIIMLLLIMCILINVFLFTLIVIILGVWVYIRLMHPITLTIKQITSAGVQPIHTRAKRVYGDGNVPFLKILGERDPIKKKISLPPDAYREIQTNGKPHYTIYRTETGDVFYTQEKLNITAIPASLTNEVPDELLDIREPLEKDKKIKEWKSEKINEYIKEQGAELGYKPITANQRVIYFNNARKAIERRQTQGFAQWAPYIMTGAVTIVFAFLIIFLVVMWQDINKPLIELEKEKVAQAKVWESTAQTQERMVIVLENLERDVQQLRSQTENQGGKPPN